MAAKKVVELKIVPTFTPPNQIDICVPVPDDYPDTPLAVWCKEKEYGCFAKLRMTIMSRAEFVAKRRLSHLYQAYYPWAETAAAVAAVLFLHSFYVHSAIDEVGDERVQRGERAMLRGIGKRMLCYAVRTMIDRHHLTASIDNVYVAAEASGARARDVAESAAEFAQSIGDEDEEGGDTAVTIEKIIYTLYMTYPTELMTHISNPKSMSADEYAYMLYSTMANTKLVDYYTRTYGFELWQQSISACALIGVTARKLLDHYDDGAAAAPEGPSSGGRGGSGSGAAAASGSGAAPLRKRRRRREDK
jgi:hypothetical protein